MKKSLLSLSVLACLVSVTACAQTAAQPEQDPVISAEMVATVCVPDLPAKLDFAGEKVPLQYPDVQEALEREMCGTIYMHSRTLRTLRMTTRYFPVIEPILQRYGVPDDFKYLCMAESGLDPNISSPVGASGLWQFMPASAKEFGLETGANVDQRYHIEMATEAACKYLKKAYERYGNWTMAAASYNLGVAGVSRRMETQGVSSYYDMFLPDETMRYVYRILSFKILTESPQKYGFQLRRQDYLSPYENYKKVTVSDEQIEWSAFAAKVGTTYKMLRILNPWILSYSYTNTAKKTYTVLVPTEGFRENGR